MNNENSVPVDGLETPGSSESAEKMKTQEKKLAQAKEDLLKVDPYDYQALGEAQAGIHELEQRIEALEEEWLLVAEQMEG